MSLYSASGASRDFKFRGGQMASASEPKKNYYRPHESPPKKIKSDLKDW